MEKEKALENPPYEKRKDEQDMLDQAILEILRMEDRLDNLKAAINMVLKMREEGAGERTKVLVGWGRTTGER